jgi:hypothetical protein
MQFAILAVAFACDYTVQQQVVVKAPVVVAQAVDHYCETPVVQRQVIEVQRAPVYVQRNVVEVQQAPVYVQRNVVVQKNVVEVQKQVVQKNVVVQKQVVQKNVVQKNVEVQRQRGLFGGLFNGRNRQRNDGVARQAVDGGGGVNINASGRARVVVK